MNRSRATVTTLALILPLVLLLLSLQIPGSQSAEAAPVDLASTQSLSPQAAAIVLEVTVGTNPAVCADTTTIQLPLGGGEATYCYTVHNTGNVTLTQHTLIDSHLGPIASDFSYPLAPGASLQFGKVALVTTTRVSTATWTASNPGPVDIAVSSDSVTVNVVPRSPAIVLDMTVGTNPAVCADTTSIQFPLGGGEATYCYTVRNTGNITLTQHTLVDSHLGPIATDFSYVLAPGASFQFGRVAPITATRVSTGTWTASNPGPLDTAVSSDSVTVNVVPPNPAIVFDLTVGTNPAVCATTSSVVFPPGGGSVTYCYSARNTGNITLTLHTLVDSRLGTILSNSPYVLGPGATRTITQTAYVATPVVNTATWTAFNPGPVNSVSANDSVTVIVSAPAPAIALDMTVGTNPGVCSGTDTAVLPMGGGNATYCYTARNTGNITLTLHTLVDNRLGTLLSNSPIALAPGGSTFITRTAYITAPLASTATWTAFNPGPVNTAVATDAVTVTVASPNRAIVLDKTVGTVPSICSQSDSTLLPYGGGDATYCYTVRNTGSITFTRHSLVDDKLGSILADFPYALSPGASYSITTTARITADTINSATWTAYNPGPADMSVSTDVAAVRVLKRVYLPTIQRP